MRSISWRMALKLAGPFRTSKARQRMAETISQAMRRQIDSILEKALK
jgi:hypothetical protein